MIKKSVNEQPSADNNGFADKVSNFLKKTKW